jgi:hypothetical protein
MWQFMKRIWTKSVTKPTKRRRPKARLHVEGLELRVLAAGLVLPLEPVSTEPTGNTYYVGSANGGVWKTTDGGVGFLRSMDGGKTW